ncbi:MAG: hypothetical protein WBN66_03535 [Smithella sp.]
MEPQKIELYLQPDQVAALQIMAYRQNKTIDQIIIDLIDNAPIVGRKKENEK